MMVSRLIDAQFRRIPSLQAGGSITSCVDNTLRGGLADEDVNACVEQLCTRTADRGVYLACTADVLDDRWRCDSALCTVRAICPPSTTSEARLAARFTPMLRIGNEGLVYPMRGLRRGRYSASALLPCVRTCKSTASTVLARRSQPRSYSQLLETPTICCRHLRAPRARGAAPQIAHVLAGPHAHDHGPPPDSHTTRILTVSADRWPGTLGPHCNSHSSLRHCFIRQPLLIATTSLRLSARGRMNDSRRRYGQSLRSPYPVPSARIKYSSTRKRSGHPLARQARSRDRRRLGAEGERSPVDLAHKSGAPGHDDGPTPGGDERDAPALF